MSHDFSKLFRQSRFASLVKPLKSSHTKCHPTHQLVQTTASALSRQEWGLKYALPSKIKSRYITFNNVDSLERMVDFETNGGDLWKRLRFQELDVVPTYQIEYNRSPPKNPLFEINEDFVPSSASSSVGTSIELLLDLEPNASKEKIQSTMKSLESLRPEFKEWLLKTNPNILNPKKNTTYDSVVSSMIEFLKEHNKKKTVNSIQSIKNKQGHYKIKGFGGLSYGLKGRIINSPNGYVQKNVVPARLLGEHSTKNVAVGGFIGETKTTSVSSISAKILNSKGKTLREEIIPMRAQSATMYENGEVKINLEPVTGPQLATFNFSLSEKKIKRKKQPQKFREELIGRGFGP